MANMFPNIDNVKGIHTRSKNHGSDNKQVKEPPTECIIKGLETGLFNFSSKFDQTQITLQPGPHISTPILIL